MNHEGYCTSAMLQNWVHTSTFVQFIDTLVTIFAAEPPLQIIPQSPTYGSNENYSSADSQSSQQLSSQNPSQNNQQQMRSPEPQILFDLDLVEPPPGYEKAKSKLPHLEAKLKEAYTRFSKEANDDIDSLLKEGENLQNRSARLDTALQTVHDDIVCK